MPPRRDLESATGLGQANRVIAAIAGSAFGTYAYNVAIAVYAYQETHSATWIAIVTVGRYVPALIINWLLAGVVDRLPRRALAVAADLGCSVIMLVLAGLAAVHTPVGGVATVAALSSALARVQASSVLALAADVVAERQVARASTLAAASEAVAAALGSAVAAAVLIGAAPPVLFLVNAASFLVSAALLVSLRLSVPSSTARPNVVAESTQTIAPASSSSGAARTRSGATAFWPLQSARAIIALVNGADVVLLTVIAARQFHDSGGYGWLLGAAGLGGLLAIVPTRRLQGTHTAATCTAGLLIYALPLFILAAHPPIAVIIVCQMVRGGGTVVATSAVIAGLQRSVPSSISGRVFGATQSLVLVGTCIGAVLTPLLLDIAGLGTALIVLAVAFCAAQLLLLPALRRFEAGESALIAALDPTVSTLRGLDLLRDASRATLYAIADGCEDVTLPAATVVVAEGDSSDAFFVLATGTVAASALGSDGPVELRQLAAPDYFGEIGLLRNVRRTATVTTVTDCSLWRVPAEVFLTAVSQAGVSGALSDTTQLRFGTRPQHSRDTGGSASLVRADAD